MTSLLIGLLLGGGITTGQPASSFTPTNAPNIQQCTTADLTLYVNKAGSDSNACTSASAACLTPQGALNKAPHCLRHQLTISLDAGSYPGFIVSGFDIDIGKQTTTAGILIDGMLANSTTLDGGAATGTAASGAAGSGSTFGTMTVGNTGAANWVSGDLVGRFITTATPTNTARVIVANDAGTLTIAGTWNLPTGSTTYQIQDPAVLINTAATLAGTPVSAASANRAAVIVADTVTSYNTKAVVVRGMALTNSSGQGVLVEGVSGVQAEEMAFRTGSTTSQAARLGLNSEVPGSLSLVNVDMATSSVGGVVVQNGSFSVSNSLIRSLNNLSNAITLGNRTGSTSQLSGMTGTRLNMLNGLVLNGNANGATASVYAGNQISCSTSSGVGIQLGTTVVSATLLAPPTMLGPVSTTAIDTCGTGLKVAGPAVASVDTLTGTAGTTALDARNGGVIYATSSTTITGATSDVALDSSAKTIAFSGITSGTCFGNMPSGSKVCNGATTSAVGYQENDITFLADAGYIAQLTIGGGSSNGRNIPVAVPNDGGAPTVAIEYGRDVMSTGTKTVTFKNAFSVAPACFCTDGTAVNGCDVPISTISTTQAVVNGTTTDQFSWFCIGDR